MSECSDAVVIIVSEETGAISIAIEGMLKRHLNADALDKLLHSELVRELDTVARPGFWGFVDKFRNIIRKGDAAE